MVVGQGIIHLATHGEFPEADAIDFHRILLAATAGYDGKLDAEEIRRLNLRSARLVVLSICNGGLYRFGPGDEPYGLVPAFLTAGVENVLGALWPIDDKTGRHFTIQFYKHLLQDGPADALRNACRTSIRDRRSMCGTGPDSG